MAKTNFNFQATLKLQSKEFQKGVKDIQRSLAGLKSSFLNFASALGLTVGLGKFISMMKDTAVKLDTAKNVLKNVSTDTVEYTQNMEHLRKLSNEYGQDLIVLINNFGQFRAAAKDSGLEIESLRKIYGSLVRAAGAYHMSADRTNDMMVAVTQMFSKGKVAAEELRRQLGNSLPGAFNIMAKAAGIAGITTHGTTAELEDMMRKGQVLAKDVMPTFAALLDEITANASFDSLQQSLNRLKNSWTSFVEQANFAGSFKKLVDALDGGLQSITKNFNIVKALLFGAGTGILTGTIWKRASGFVQKWNTDTANAYQQNEKELQKLWDKLETFKEKYNIAFNQKGAKVSTVGQEKMLEYFQKQDEGFKEACKTVIDYNNVLIKHNQLEKQLGLGARVTKKEIKALRLESEMAATVAQTVPQAFVKQMTLAQKATAMLRKGIQLVGAAIKSISISTVIGLVIAAVTTLVTRLIEARREIKRINSIVEESEKAIDRVTGAESETVIELRKCRDELLKNEKGSLRFQKAIEGVNKIMGKTGEEAFTVESNVNDIVAAVDEWIAKLKKVARAQAIIAKINELTAKNIELENENDMIRSDDNSYWYKGKKGKTDQMMRTRYYEKIANNTLEMKNNTKAIDNLTSKLDEDDLKQLYGGDNNGGNNDNNDDDKDKSKKKTNLDKVTELFDEYDKKAKELNNQLKAGAITAEEYQKELDKLVDSTYKSVTALGDLGEYLRADNKGIGQKTIDEFKKKLDNLKLAFDDIVDNSHDDQQKELGKQLYDKISDNVQKGFQKRMDQDVKNRKAQDIYSSIRGPKERDTSFDYKKDKADIAKEDYENAEEYLKYLRDLRNELVKLGQVGTEQFNQLNILIGEAAAQTTSFRDRAKLAEWKKDVEELSKAYNEQLYSSVKDVSQSVERLYNVYKDFAEVFGEEIDPDGNFQKILTVFSALFETFETIYTIVKSMHALSEASAALEKAKDDEKMRALAEQITLEGTLGATKVTAAEAAAVAMAGETVAAKALAASLKDVAAAATVANAMELPYPYNLAALASNVAAAAGAYTTMKGLQAFAKGGIVGGPNHGTDNTLVRATPGEMVLSKGEQATLFNAIKNGNLGGSGKVDFIIRGDNLYGTLKNYQRKRMG